MSAPTRNESDTLGNVAIAADRLWGAQTQRSLQYFSIGTELMPREMVQAYAWLKKACAEANRRAGADMLLVLPRTPEEARTIGERIEGPLFYFMLAGTASMGMTLAELGQLGYRIVCDATTPLLARQKALRLCYEALAQGLPDPTLAGAYKEEDRLIHQTIELEKLLAVERRTVER